MADVGAPPLALELWINPKTAEPLDRTSASEDGERPEPRRASRRRFSIGAAGKRPGAPWPAFAPWSAKVPTRRISGTHAACSTRWALRWG